MKVTLAFILISILTLFILYKFNLTKRNKLSYNKTYEFKGSTMNYRMLGSGEKVILIHGSLINNPWGGFENMLAENYEVYLPDLPGFGGSDAVEGERHDIDLFSNSICEFIEQNDFHEVPIIGFSMGANVAVNVAARGCTDAKLVLVGLAGRIGGERFELADKVPLFLKRMIIATDWGKRKILVPIVNENVGAGNNDVSSDFVDLLKTTDYRSLVDRDIKKEVDEQLPKILPMIKNDLVFIYGENDLLKETTTDLIDDYITIKNAGHNVFVDNPSETLTSIKEAVK